MWYPDNSECKERQTESGLDMMRMRMRVRVMEMKKKKGRESGGDNSPCPSPPPKGHTAGVIEPLSQEPSRGQMRLANWTVSLASSLKSRGPEEPFSLSRIPEEVTPGAEARGGAPGDLPVTLDTWLGAARIRSPGSTTL